MEMEKDVLFANGNFYYSGAPVQSTTVKNEGIIKDLDKVVDSLENVFSIVQVLIIIFSIICFIKAIKTYIDNKKISRDFNNDVIKGVEDTVENDGIKKESATKYFIMYIVMNIGYICIEFMKSVLGKI